MRTHRWAMYPHRKPEPFVVVDAEGRPCGHYYTIPEADRAVDFLNAHGNHQPYTVARPESTPTWNPRVA